MSRSACFRLILVEKSQNKNFATAFTIASTIVMVVLQFVKIGFVSSFAHHGQLQRCYTGQISTATVRTGATKTFALAAIDTTKHVLI